MKYKTLQKQLIKIALIAVIGVAISAAAGFAVFSWSDKLVTQKKNIDSKLSTTRRDINTKDQRAQAAEEYQKKYEAIVSANKVKNSDLDREVALKWVTGAAKHFELIRLDGTFDPIVIIKNPAFQKKTYQAISSRVSFTFAGLNDENVFKFLDVLIHHFPGYVKVNKLEVRKIQDVSDLILQQIAHGDKPALVEGKIDFFWLGVKKIGEDEALTEEVKPATNGIPGMGGPL